ncbi:HAD phosphatase [Dichomitus squalens]|uniref:HAD phosphatase n=2 Tax=Dichomitus squalens TaxID=114155 RepID=A0A4Q9NKV0_9APHY|nr:HAD phosphatase [Dichomitus squalens LYAD-421 SS1]EJF57248.1 HAD phosphatase [Dichomitus squalens LYAD-421 SS1]TBU40301.1 HAD phosphatase [Dichomitus squalens]TBU54114.1 HAD phosphatase [Dichomitus squalens]
MPFNLPGILAPLHLLINPRLVLPSVVVKDIRQIDFQALHKAGYRGAVFDKDNCLTIPHEDCLVPELTDAWRECRETFGPGNVLIVSNTAGSHIDVGEIEAESVTHHLSVPVLRHASLKPSYSCIKSIRAYFRSLPQPVRDEELVIVGDRLLTDVIMANRMARKKLSRGAIPPDEKRALIEERDEGSGPALLDRVGPLAVWTDGLWKRESLVLRAIEKGMLKGVERWVLGPQEAAWREGLQHRFVKPVSVVEEPAESRGLVRRIWERLQR